MAHAQHESHGSHGHHAPDIKAPIFWMAIIIVGFCGWASYLARSGQAKHAETSAAPAHSPQMIHVNAPPARQHHDDVVTAKGGKAIPAGDAAMRAAFVAEFHRRQRKMGYDLRASTGGDNHDVFSIAFPAKADAQKIAELKKAAPLHDAAKARGFKRFEIRVGDLPVWNKPL